MLRRYLYVSVSTLPKSHALQTVEAIVTAARVRNTACGVTGSLIFSGNRFAQYLEGPEEALEVIVANILADERHCRITTLLNELAEKRLHPDWFMSYAAPSIYIDRHISPLIEADIQSPLTEGKIRRLLYLIMSFAGNTRI
jgi:hypothetical protein